MRSASEIHHKTTIERMTYSQIESHGASRNDLHSEKNGPGWQVNLIEFRQLPMRRFMGERVLDLTISIGAQI